LEAKRMTSQYQKEAEKCDSGMGSCEAAREKAEKYWKNRGNLLQYGSLGLAREDVEKVS
jgi:hypothetical protein